MGLQADHKIPLIRGGESRLENWQPLCNECNVMKRSACAGCRDNCRECAWAFPDEKGKIVLVRVSKHLLQKAKETGIASPVQMEGVLKDALESI